jgi:hypothetical protein
VDQAIADAQGEAEAILARARQAALSADPVAGPFISAAFSLMQLIISRAMA